jgi:hypothetical protein
MELFPHLAPREEAEARGAFPNIWRGYDAFLAGRMSEPPKEVEGQARLKRRGRQPEPIAKRKIAFRPAHTRRAKHISANKVNGSTLP